jgi:hypothetical protein
MKTLFFIIPEGKRLMFETSAAQCCAGLAVLFVV